MKKLFSKNPIVSLLRYTWKYSFDARGILAARDSDFLFMDEPTSSVDTENEIKIYERIFEKLKKKTIISSVHRLHLLRYFDYIYYFKDGKLLTEGTFRTLLEDENFKALWEKYKSDKNRGRISLLGPS